MIPNEFKILRLQRLVQLSLIIFLIMSQIMAPALSVSKPECNNRNVKLKTFYNTGSEGYLAVVNNSITIVSHEHPLYTINGAKRSPQFYIFDPDAKMFICASKKEKFIAKPMPKPPSMCLFNEVIDKEKSGEIKLMVKKRTLIVTKKGQQHPSRHKKKYQYYIAMCHDSRPPIVEKLCSLLPPRERRLNKFKRLANCSK